MAILAKEPKKPNLGQKAFQQQVTVPIDESKWREQVKLHKKERKKIQSNICRILKSRILEDVGFQRIPTGSNGFLNGFPRIPTETNGFQRIPTDSNGFQF